MRKTIESMDRDQLEEEDDLLAVVLNDKWCSHYRRVHLQYEAMVAAINHPAMKNMELSHNWDKRVVEFEPSQDTIQPQ